MARVRLSLWDDKGRVVATAESQFDGFYLFEKVLPGSYFLGADPEQAQRLKLEAPPRREIRLEPGEVKSGLDFRLALTTTSET